MKTFFLHNFPNISSDIPRRRFLKHAAGAAAVVGSLPFLKCGTDNGGASLDEIQQAARNLPAGDAGGEKFWQAVKEQFPIREGLVMVNAANLCPAALPVQQDIIRYTKDIDTDASFVNRGKYNGMREEARTALAAYLGADAEEIALTRNTSESNNVVISGLSLGRGDEVVIWDQNHPTANVAWDVRAERYGYAVKRVSTPTDAGSPDDFYKVFENALSSRTKVLAFSHVSNVSGEALPAKEICAMARNRGILTLVDGAQTFGIQALDLHDIGCDFYTGSSHKWFCGPKEVGVLYVRRELAESLHPLIVGVGWEGAVNSGAKKFETLGQRDDSRVAAMKTAVDFHNAIGKERIEKRVRWIAQTLKTGIRSMRPDVLLHTPVDQSMSLGVVVFMHEKIDRGSAANMLYEKYNIGCAAMGGTYGGVRFSPHLYNTQDDIDVLLSAVKQLTA
ncbi:aminotransferase class V-fold PLP-dependent enzyme [candidate division KSB1 bacterium]